MRPSSVKLGQQRKHRACQELMDASPWSTADWQRFERRCGLDARRAKSDEQAWRVLSRHARTVLRAYSTSFFIVTRFLPARKRAQVEAVYAAVRQPDEIVDSFPYAPSEQEAILTAWREQYEISLSIPSIREALRAGVPPFLAAFTQVVREADIPEEHYQSFLDAMLRDVHPRPFESMDALVEDYIYGSAIVVGAFLTYIYGAASPATFDDALTCARRLGIALQLTNFARDVGEDQRRGRLYVPLEALRAAGIVQPDVHDPMQQSGWQQAIRSLVDEAEAQYAAAETGIAAFHPDSRLAIHACIAVYRELNRQIGGSPDGIHHRASVPFGAKFRVLPRSKYWRLPLAYLSF